MSITLTIALICSILQVTHQEQCTLNNQSRTQGICTHIRSCKYQLGRYRVGSPVTNCNQKGYVCCPNGPSVSERKCSDWLEMLYAPTVFSQPRFTETTCAVSLREFIVGGRLAYPFEYPHSVALGFGQDENKLKFLCGATLISEKFLVTAAHCVTHQRYGKPSYAVIGDTVLDHNKAGSSGKATTYRQVVKIDRHYVHPDYLPPRIYNDIALLSLSTPLDLSRYVLPACLGTPLTSPKKNAQVEASGWGITDAASQTTSNSLQAINITTIDSGDCNSFYSAENDKPYRYPDGVVRSQMCATGEDKDTCSGDSGGGLYIRQSKCLFHVVGVTSIGTKLCGLGSPAIYTTVASYQDWIESIVWPNEK